MGIALDNAGHVYIADACNYRIQTFTALGEFIASWGGRGSGNGQFEYPYDLVVDGSGNVYVSDSGNHRVQMFTGSGEFLRSWGSYERVMASSSIRME